MPSSNTPASTHQSQGSDGPTKPQAEEATAGSTTQPAHQQQHMIGEAPDDSENAPAAEFPTSSIASTGHLQATAPRQGHNDRESFLPAMLQRSTGRHSQARRRDPALISAIIQRVSSVPNIYDSQRPVTAVLVDEEDIPTGEIVEAQAVGFFEQKWKLMVFVVVVVAGALLALGLTVGRQQPSPITPSPTSSPTLKPTFDRRPTIEQIQERGFVKCGWNDRFVPLRYRVCELILCAIW